MKKLILIIFVLLLVNTGIYSQGFYPQTSGTTEDLRGVWFTDSDKGTAVGNSGTILRTTDAGHSWLSQTSGTVENLWSACFIDANTAIVVGDNGTILRTTDAGDNWTSVTSGTTELLLDVKFVDSNNGFTVGDNGTILKTTDGGITWNSQTSGTTLVLRSIAVEDANTIYIVGNEGIFLKSTDAGLNWSSSTISSNPYFDIAFSSSTNAVAISNSSKIARTTDGGISWNTQNVSIYNYNLRGVSFISSDTGYVAGGNTRVFRTTDSGSNWYVLSSLSSENLEDIYFSDHSNGVAVGLNGIIVTTTSSNLETTPPIITSVSLAADNSYLDVTWDKAVYSDRFRTITIPISRLSLSISGGIATNPTITSVTNPSDAGVSSGETTIRIYFSLSGTPDGGETLSIVPKTSSIIYDYFGNAASTSQSNNTTTLYDETGPRILSVGLATDNSYIDVTWDEAVYNTDGGSGALETSDFSLSLSGGTATNPTITSVTKTNNGALSGGETTIRINFSVSGTPDGSEALTINPAEEDAFYDIFGNGVSTTQSNNTATMNDKLRPIISGVSLAADNSYIDVTWDEGVYNTDGGSGALETSDLSLSLSGGTATNPTITSVTKTNNGALSGGETTIRINFSVTGTPDGSETLAVVPSAVDAVYDAAGNASSTTQSNNSSIMNDLLNPIIVSVNLASDNSYIDVTWNEGIFNTNSGSGTVDLSDFSLSSSGGSSTNPTITSLTNTSGNALSGGETTIRINFSIIGPPDGSETLTVVPSGADAIYDVAGNAASTTQSNNSVTMNPVTGPRITDVDLASDNSYVDVTFDEATYNTNGGSGALEISDFSLSLSGGAATNPTSTSITNTSNVALSGGETTIRIYFSVTGTPDGSEILTIEVATLSSIYDGAGNAAFTTQNNNSTTLNDQAVPKIMSISRPEDSNNRIDVTWSEAVYSTTGGSGAVEISDFSLLIIGGTAINPTVTSVTNTSNAALSGGETTIRIYFSVTGSFDGYETLTVVPASISSIYDSVGNSASIIQSNNSVSISGSSLGDNIDLSNASASFWGEDADDQSGRSVSGIGDVNGDGYDDFLVGAPLDDDGGTDAGQTYLILGKSSGWAMDADLSAADASFIGEGADDLSGWSVSGAGDVNGDGYDDFLIGARGNDDSGADAGQTYLIFGKSSGWSMDTDLSAADASFIGEDGGDQSGRSVSGAGDVNGDGYGDILIGALGDDDNGSNAGQTYLIFGKSSGWSMDTDLSAADASFIGEGADDLSGWSVSGAGDVNGDGFDDIIIGANFYEHLGRQVGKTYLILGKSSGWSMDFNLSNADASFRGTGDTKNSGFSVSDAGDVNGDGYDDFLIGDNKDDEVGTDAGQTYLILGKSSGWANDTKLKDTDASFWGENSGDQSGYSVSGIGDINHDGYDDFIIGSRYNNFNGTKAGQTYIILGKSSGWSMDTDLSTANGSYYGEGADDLSGWSVSGAGDVNGDGYDDFLIGARGDEDGGNNAGQTYVWLSGQSGSTTATYRNFIANGNPPAARFENAGVIVDFSAVTSSNGTLTVAEHNNTNPPNITGSAANRYWTITPSGLSSYTFTIILDYTDAEISESGGAEENMKIYRNDGGGWVEVTTVVDADKNTLTATNQSAFSDWAIGNSESPLPVELTLFEGYNTEDGVVLIWETATEVNNYGFQVQRQKEKVESENQWEEIGFVNGHGTTNSPKSYSFTDTELPDTSTVSYRLKQIDNDGKFAYSKSIDVNLTTITSVEEEEIPIVYSLSQNYPNPFNPTTTIKFGLPEQGFVDLSVYNILGQEVAKLINQELSAGYHEVVFGTNNIASGMYIYRISVGDKFNSVKKMLLMK